MGQDFSIVDCTHFAVMQRLGVHAAASFHFDLGVRAPLYARAGITITWVVDLVERCVHELSEPNAGEYRTTRRSRPAAASPYRT